MLVLNVLAIKLKLKSYNLNFVFKDKKIFYIYILSKQTKQNRTHGLNIRECELSSLASLINVSSITTMYMGLGSLLLG